MASEYESAGLAYRHISIAIPKSLKSELERFGVNMTKVCVSALEAEVKKLSGVKS
ncbi:MAG: hypothetical protein PHF57_04915 [Methanoregula sp.]|jgi:hypothetical protein|nr:hypothetical protein [Methanoregula sp.]